jgi:tripartite-type tricarboxylate transporter receptor subunit TctC
MSKNLKTKLVRRNFLSLSSSACGLFYLNTFNAFAADIYPNKSIKFIVPYAPGGGSDILARPVAAKLTESLGKVVFVENHAGSGTNLGSDLAARSPADGYTLFMPTIANAINPTLYPKLPYDPIKDFSYITNIAKVPGILCINPSLPIHSVQDLIAYARAKPGKLAFSSAGNGSPHHLAGELFKIMTNTNMIHIPYKGATPALNDVLAGHVQVYFGSIVPAMPHVKSGGLRAIGVTSLRRVSSVPDLPTLDEQGLKGFETGSWFGVAVPSGTSKDIVQLLNREIVRIIKIPEVIAPIAAEGADFVGDSPEEFTKFVKDEIVRWGKVVKISGAKID